MLAVLYFTIYLFPFTLSIRYFRVNVKSCKHLSTSAFDTCVSEKLLDGAHKCVADHQCESLLFNKTSSLCGLYSTFKKDRYQYSDLLYVPLGHETCLMSSKPTPSAIHVPRTSDPSESGGVPHLKIIKRHMTYQDARRQCEKKGGRLFMIDSQKKQDMAVKVARESGLDYIAVGIFCSTFRWYYSNNNRVKYTSWAPGHPIGLFAVLSRQHGYLWIGSISKVKAGMCEMR